MLEEKIERIITDSTDLKNNLKLQESLFKNFKTLQDNLEKKSEDEIKKLTKEKFDLVVDFEKLGKNFENQKLIIEELENKIILLKKNDEDKNKKYDLELKSLLNENEKIKFILNNLNQEKEGIIFLYNN
jgi:hypothetical protein